MRRLIIPLLLAVLVLGACSSGDDVPDAMANDTMADEDPENNGAVGPDEEPAEVMGAVDAVEGSPLMSVVVPADGPLGFEIPADAPAPVAAERLEVAPGDGEQVGADGIAAVTYVMASWDGTIVEESTEYAPQLLVRIGTPADQPPETVDVPLAVEEAIGASTVGSRIVVGFPGSIGDLPSQFDRDDSYLLVIDIHSFQTPNS